MPRMLIVKLVIFVLKAIIPGLESRAKETSNHVDDALLAIVKDLVSAYDSGELKKLIEMT